MTTAAKPPPSRTEEARASRGWDKITIRAPFTVAARARALAVDGRTLADVLEAGCEVLEDERGPPSEPPG